MNEQHRLEGNTQVYHCYLPEARDPQSHNIELCNLPDCVVSYIFSMLSMKHLVRTSILSKKRYNELWGLKRDLNFDHLNMFGSNDEVTKFPWYQSQFVRCVDNFVHRRSAKIGKFRLKFPLGNDHKDTLDKWITQAIDKGAESIELLLSFKGYGTNFIRIKGPYEFPCSLFSGTGSLKYLHLQNCLVVPPIGFLGFKKLTTIVLDHIFVEQNLLQCLFSNCSHLEDLTFDSCDFSCDLKIISPKLHHLKIFYFGQRLGYQDHQHRKIDIVALNLSSFEYSGISSSITSLEAPNLLKFCLCCIHMPLVDFSWLKKLRTLELQGHVLDQYWFLCLLSECSNLEELTIISGLATDIHVISPSLHHLKIVDCHHWPVGKLYIDTLNLSSLHYRGQARLCSIKAPQLLKTYFDATDREEIPCAFALMANLQQLENLTMVVDRLNIQYLPRGFGPFQHLKYLELILDGAIRPEMNFSWVLKIVEASPHLQKLVLKITHPHLFANQRPRRKKYRKFFHNELKFVDFYGFVGNMNEIELTSQLLKHVNSLEQITFRCSDERVYIGARTWIQDWKTKHRHKEECNFFHGISWILDWKTTKHRHKREIDFFHDMLQGKDNESGQVMFL